MLAALVFLLATAPLADDPAFQEGVRLYGDFEFEQAAFRFEAAALDKERASSERARVFAWLGLAYAALGRFDDAERSFHDALRLDPGVVLETEVSPKVSEVFERAKAARASEAKAVAAKEPIVEAAPPQVEEPPPASAPWLLVGGAVAGATGVVAFGAASVLGVLAAGNVDIARDPDAFQDTAKAALDAANAQIVSAVVVGAAGAVLLVGGVGAAAFDLATE